MQRDTLLVSPSMPLAPTVGRDQEANTSGDPNKSESETRSCTRPKSKRRPSMSKVILRAVADKGARSRVSLAALKKAVTTTGYNMAHNTWRFKRVLQNLVKKGMLKQVTGRGATGSFRLGKKQAFKSKRKIKRSGRRQQKRKAGQRGSGPRKSLPGPRKSHKRLFKRVRKVAKGCRH